MADKEGLGGERTEKPTSKHRQDARKDGNIFKSQEIVTLVSLVVLFYAYRLFYPFVQSRMLAFMRERFQLIGTAEHFNNDDARQLFISCAIIIVTVTFPIILIASAIGILGIVTQTKMYVNFKKLKPDFKKLNPIKGFKELLSKMFGYKGWVKQLIESAKVFVIFWSIYNIVNKEWHILPRFMDIPLPATAEYTSGLIIDIVRTVAIAYIFIVAANFMYEKFQYEKNLKMSKQEIKEENKQMEGDPKIKAKIRQKQMQMGMSRIREAMTKADVVIRNPTHYAVALQYDRGNMEAPVVVAKGIDFIALKIIDLAKEYDVYCMENRPLARALYDNVNIDREIPPEYYQAVADILAFVYSLKEENKKGVNHIKAPQDMGFSS